MTKFEYFCENIRFFDFLSKIVIIFAPDEIETFFSNHCIKFFVLDVFPNPVQCPGEGG